VERRRVSVRVLQSGLHTTVQDLGREGHQRDGIPVSGAMDRWALRVANLLVGNDEGAAALEITLVGPSLTFDGPALIALAGADLGAVVGDVPVALWHPLWVPAGASLGFRGGAPGCRTYLAIAGGIDVPKVLGSRSTYVRAGIGGHMGRALRRGDALCWGAPAPLAEHIIAGVTAGATAGARRTDRRVAPARWGAAPSLRPRYSDAPVVRLLPGTHADLLTEASAETLHGAPFRIAPQSDRMGFRLEGTPLELREPVELLSEGVTFGTVQLPPGGQPIVLMADRQTTGGYPRIGEVASVDLPLIAQLRPGDRVRFRRCSLEEAQAEYLAHERELDQARRAITLAWS
jgi:antagonist of KipI